MRKPRFYLGRAFDKNITKEAKELYAKQRKERGFDDTELWCFDVTLARYLIPRLQRLKEIAVGYPAEFDSPEEWDKVLDKIIWACNYESNTGIIEATEEGDRRAQEGFNLLGKYFQCLGD